MLGSAKSEDPRLIIREIIVKVVQPTYDHNTSTSRQTVDRRTDDFYRPTMTIPHCADSIAR